MCSTNANRADRAFLAGYMLKYANRKESMMSNNQANKNSQPYKIDIKPSMDISDGQLFQLEPDSLAALREVAAVFEYGRMYKEKEVNEILKVFHEDHVMLRRFLIEHGLLGRNRDGSQYWSTDVSKKGF